MAKVNNLLKADGTFHTKKIKWTIEALKSEAEGCLSRSDFKRKNPAAYKAARIRCHLDNLFPDKLRITWTEALVREAAKDCTSRSAFQKAAPYAYIFASKTDLLKQLFPVQKNAKRWNKETLTAEAAKYSSRVEMYEGSPGAHSVAVKLGLLDEIGLPPAMQGFSVAELELLVFLQTLSPDFVTKRFGNDFELDCYSEALQLGVEYNGLYWHSEESKRRSYHKDKTEYFEKRGVRIIHIWENEWRDKRSQVESYLRSACGKNAVRIGARKCEFKELTVSAAKLFLEHTHIQGSSPSVTFALGCFYKGALLGVCTFGKHHRGGEGVILNRFACLPNHTVSGFLAKASQIAAKRFGTLHSWAHYAKSQARGYLAAGWEAIKTHPPDYFYATAQAQVVSKQARKKSAVGTPPHMTEAEHAKADGLYRIWDCGKILLKYSPKHVS